MRKIAAIAAAGAMLGATAVAIGQAQQVNVYGVKGSVLPAKPGSKTRPVPVGVTFNYTVDEKSGAQQPAAVKRYKISFYGVRNNGGKFPTCTFAQITAAKSDKECKPGSLVGSGVINNVIYPNNNPASTDKLIQCKKELRVRNAGQDKAVLFLTGPASNCGGVGDQVIAAKYVKETAGGGTALQFDVPAKILHAVPEITLAVRSVTSTIKKLQVTKDGRTYGYYESIACKRGKRPITVTFTAETGQVSKVTKNANC